MVIIIVALQFQAIQGLLNIKIEKGKKFLKTNISTKICLF
jgi:hypothetical protein